MKIPPTFILVLAISLSSGASTAGAACLVRAQAGAAFQEVPFGVASANDSTPQGSTGTTASYGSLSASSIVSLTESGSDGGSSPIPIAHFEDDWTVTVPSQPGLVSGTITVNFLLVGEPTIELMAGGAGALHEMNTNYQLLVMRNGGTVHNVTGGRIHSSGMVPPDAVNGTVPAPGAIEVDLPVVFGDPMNVAFDLISTTGGTMILQSGQTGFTLGRSIMGLYWDGITSIRDGSGNELIGQAVVTSCSGTNWFESQAPPVPNGWVVWFGSALAALAMGATMLRRIST